MRYQETKLSSENPYHHPGVIVKSINQIINGANEIFLKIIQENRMNLFERIG